MIEKHKVLPRVRHQVLIKIRKRPYGSCGCRGAFCDNVPGLPGEDQLAVVKGERNAVISMDGCERNIVLHKGDDVLYLAPGEYIFRAANGQGGAAVVVENQSGLGIGQGAAPGAGHAIRLETEGAQLFAVVESDDDLIIFQGERVYIACVAVFAQENILHDQRVAAHVPAGHGQGHGGADHLPRAVSAELDGVAKGGITVAAIPGTDEGNLLGAGGNAQQTKAHQQGKQPVHIDTPL